MKDPGQEQNKQTTPRLQTSRGVLNIRMQIPEYPVQKGYSASCGKYFMYCTRWKNSPCEEP